MTIYRWRKTQRRNFSCHGLSAYSPVSHGGGLTSIPGRACGVWGKLSSFVYVCLGVIRISSLSISPLTLHTHSFILSLSWRLNNTTVCHIQFEINTQLLINLCNCIRMFISLVYTSCEANVNTCCRLYEVVETVHEKMCDKVVLKFVEIWLIVIGWSKVRKQHNCRFS